MKKAMGTEAKAGLGTMRTGLRVVMAESNAYDGSDDAAATGPITPGVADNIPGIDPLDLDGSYFDHNDYRIDAITDTAFLLVCVGDADSGVGTHIGDANLIVVTLNQDGDWGDVDPG